MSILPKSPGIYIITCVPTGKIYVGSAVNLHRRWTTHKYILRKGKHINQRLQRAWRKYGEVAFTIEILELVMPWSVLDREQYWLDTLKPFDKRGFNLAHDAHAPTRGLKHTPEHRAKISAGNKGKRRSLETRARMTEAQRRRPKPTAEACRNMSIAHSFRWIVTSPEGDTFEILGLTQFCKEHNLSSGTLFKVATGEQKHHKGWKCRRK